MNATLNGLLLNEVVTNVSVPPFAFVRNPFERFLSAFTEVIFRTYSIRQLREADGSPLKLNQSSAMHYIRQILDFKNPLLQTEHIYAMSGALFPYNIGFFGRLEHLAEDWNRTIMPLYGISNSYDDMYGQHPTSLLHPRTGQPSSEGLNKKNVSKDPNNARMELLKLFASRKDYMRAVCHLILVDFICLPFYPLPIDCQFLNRTREVAVNAVLAGRIVPTEGSQ